MRTIFSTLAALAAGLIAAVAMGQEGGRDPAPSALQPGPQQPEAQLPAPQDVTQPAPPPGVPTDASVAPALGADGPQPDPTQATDVERRLENRAQVERDLNRADALNQRRREALENRDIGRDAAANRANRSFNDYRENRGAEQVRTGELGAAESRWRYVRHNNQWWYWTPQSTWLIWSGDRWVPQGEFNRQYATRPYQGTYRTGYRGDYYDDGYYDRGYYDRGYYGPGRGYYGRGYYGRGYYGPGYGYGPGYYSPGAATGAGIGGAIGGRGGANVGAAIGGAIGGW